MKIKPSTVSIYKNIEIPFVSLSNFSKVSYISHVVAVIPTSYKKKYLKIRKSLRRQCIYITSHTSCNKAVKFAIRKPRCYSTLILHITKYRSSHRHVYFFVSATDALTLAFKTFFWLAKMKFNLNCQFFMFWGKLGLRGNKDKQT